MTGRPRAHPAAPLCSTAVIHDGSATTAMSDAADHPTRAEYQQRLQPERENGADAFAGLLAACATVCGLLALWLAPLKLGGVGIGLAAIALACSKGRDNGPRWAFYIAATGWFVGTTLAVLLDRNPLNI